MKIRKRVKAEIPTVQYGNVEIETSLEFDTDSDSLSSEAPLRVRKVGKFLDKMVLKEYTTFADELETELERFTKFGDLKNGKKEQSRKEKIITESKRKRT